MIRSPFFTPAAFTPPARGFENSWSAVRFTTPLADRKKRERPAASRSSTGIMTTIRSWRSADPRRAYTDCPRDDRALSGTSRTGRKWQCPPSVKVRIQP